MSNQISWTQSGIAITVEVLEHAFLLTLNGVQGRHSCIALPLPKDRAMYAQRNAYGNLGRLVIYNDRAAELLSIQAELQAADPLNEYKRLESALYEAMDAVRDYRGVNPAQVYANEQNARAALNAWIESNRDLYDAEMTLREQGQAARGEALLAGKDILGM